MCEKNGKITKIVEVHSYKQADDLVSVGWRVLESGYFKTADGEGGEMPNFAFCCVWEKEDAPVYPKSYRAIY